MEQDRHEAIGAIATRRWRGKLPLILLVILGMSSVVARGEWVAAGGSVTNYTLAGTNYTAHVFLAEGLLLVNSNLSCDVLVVGGGGGGGGDLTSSGGGGGVVIRHVALINGPHSVTVGTGGTGSATQNDGLAGEPSLFGDITAHGGGGRGINSGNGASGSGSSGRTKNEGHAIDYEPYQGHDGGVYTGNHGGGGGGGAGGVGGGIGTAADVGGNGGIGLDCSFMFGDAYGDSGWFGGGGGGCSYTTGNAKIGTGGRGGGGAGGSRDVAAEHGMPNSGGGGGGGGNGAPTHIGGTGGSGIVIVRYVAVPITIAAPVVTNTGTAAVGFTAVALQGQVIDIGGEIPSAWFECWEVGSSATTIVAVATQWGAFSAPMLGLSKGTAYQYRVGASNSAGSAWSTTVSFTTQSGVADYYVAAGGTGAGSSWAHAFTDVQSALNAAVDGETIYIKGGTYAVDGEQLIWTQSNVTVLGGYQGTNASGQGNFDAALWPTILSGTRGVGAANRVMWIQGVSDCRMERVTLCNGYLHSNYYYPAPNPYAGTNDNRGVNLFVTDCKNLTLVDVTSSNAYAYTYSRSVYGLGAYFLNSTNVLMSGCVLQRNTMHAYGNDTLFGGGFYAKDSYMTVSNCTIKGNYRDNTGLGGQNDSCFGVGAYLAGGSVTLVDSIFTANDGYCRSAAAGGGVYVLSGKHMFRNCLIAANDLYPVVNRGTMQGGGIYTTGGNTVLDNCTIAYNFRQGVYRNGGTLALTNCIVWGHHDNIGGSGVGLSHCNIEDGDNAGVDGCFSSDPAFDRGFYLSAGSACIDAGVTTANSGILSLYTTQADGSLDSGTVDIGYHHAAGINSAVADFYVSPSGSDVGNSGANWTSPFRSISKALSLAADGTRVHIGSGTYTKACETFPLMLDKFGLQLLGTNSADTIIAATGSGQGVIATEAVVGNAKIEGVTITGGVGTQPSSSSAFYPFAYYDIRRYGCGGGILLAISAMDISGCIISNNTVGIYDGKGCGIYQESSMLTISNCLIADNKCTTTLYAAGAGIFVRGNSALTVVDSTIRNNHAYSSQRWAYGGGIAIADGYDNNYSRLRVRRSVIVGNQVRAANKSYVAEGAGLGLCGDSTLDNCLVAYNEFAGPSSVTNGGGICLFDGSLALQNVTIASNAIEGVRMTGGALTAINCIFWGNGDNLVNVADGVGYSCIEDGDFNGSNGNTNEEPSFVDTTYFHLTSHQADYRDGYFAGGSWSHSREDSPLIDRGNPTSDYRLEPEPNGRRINMGAYGNTEVASMTFRLMGTLFLVR